VLIEYVKKYFYPKHFNVKQLEKDTRFDVHEDDTIIRFIDGKAVNITEEVIQVIGNDGYNGLVEYIKWLLRQQEKEEENIDISELAPNISNNTNITLNNSTEIVDLFTNKTTNGTFEVEDLNITEPIDINATEPIQIGELTLNVTNETNTQINPDEIIPVNVKIDELNPTVDEQDEIIEPIIITNQTEGRKTNITLDAQGENNGTVVVIPEE